MAFKETYNNWPLGKQVRMTVFFMSLILIAMTIIVTKFQLD